MSCRFLHLDPHHQLPWISNRPRSMDIVKSTSAVSTVQMLSLVCDEPARQTTTSIIGDHNAYNYIACALCLRTRDFSASTRDDHIKTWLETAYSSEITTVRLNGSTEVTDQGIMRLATHCPNITAIGLDGCRNLTDEAICTLAEHCHKIRRIRLDSCSQITNNGVCTLAAHCPDMATISLNYCTKVTDAAIRFLAAQCTGITR
jgi:hypothetical protein